MKDDFAADVARSGDNDAIRAILEDVGRATHMGFVAVARVTDDRWIAAQVLDRIGFGLEPGEELEVATTICSEIRGSGQAVVIDHVADHDDWRTHHTPALYGFQSYASLPIVLDDGSFFGTLCAIDPDPHDLSGPALVATLKGYAARVAAILSRKA